LFGKLDYKTYINRKLSEIIGKLVAWKS